MAHVTGRDQWVGEEEVDLVIKSKRTLVLRGHPLLPNPLSPPLVWPSWASVQGHLGGWAPHNSSSWGHSTSPPILVTKRHPIGCCRWVWLR